MTNLLSHIHPFLHVYLLHLYCRIIEDSETNYMGGRSLGNSLSSKGISLYPTDFFFFGKNYTLEGRTHFSLSISSLPIYSKKPESLVLQTVFICSLAEELRLQFHADS